jgi:hypothetical protein
MPDQVRHDEDKGDLNVHRSSLGPYYVEAEAGLES